MKKQLLAICLLLSAYTSYAQQPTAPIPVAPATASPASESDTVRAIHNMFRQHRTGGIIWSSIGGVFAGRIIGSSIGNAETTASGVITGVLLLGGVPAGIGIGKLTRFSAAKEAAVVAAYTQNPMLPKYVKRRLKKRKYFAQ